MSLPKQVVDDVLHLKAHSKHFQRLLGFWKEQSEEIVMNVMSPMTDKDEREILVCLYDMFTREVVDLPNRAYKESVKPEHSTER